MGVGKVLPLQTCLWQLPLYALHEKIYEFIVGIAGDTLMPPTKVLWRFQSVFVVRSHVKHDRQGSSWVNAAYQRVKEKACQLVSPFLPHLDHQSPRFVRRLSLR